MRRVYKNLYKFINVFLMTAHQLNVYFHYSVKTFIEVESLWLVLELQFFIVCSRAVNFKNKRFDSLPPIVIIIISDGPINVYRG